MKKITLLFILLLIFTLSGCKNDDNSGYYESIEIIDVTTTLTSISFDVLMPENDSNASIIAIKLFKGNVLIETIYEGSPMIFSNLYSGTHYTIKLEAEYDNQSSEFETVVEYYEIYTEGYDTPEIEIKYVESGEEYIYFKVVLTDNDNIGSFTLLELYDGDILIDSTSDFSKRSYFDLNIATEYTIRATYTYDLKDGLGEQLLVVEYIERTDSKIAEYFVEIALGFEFGDATDIVRKWVEPIRIYIKGDPSESNLAELDKIILELNELMTDGINLSITDIEEESNMIIFFGSAEGFIDLYPTLEEYVDNNNGLGLPLYNDLDNIYHVLIYINTENIDEYLQRHLIREELTQSLGLGQDSYEYVDSVFYQNYNSVTSYMDIDKAIIWLLYNPEVISGLNEEEVIEIIEEIIKNGLPDF